MGMEQAEARDIAKAAAEVLEHYEVELISPKTLAWSNFIQVIAAGYGGRIFAYKVRKGMERASAPQRPAQAAPPTPRPAPMPPPAAAQGDAASTPQSPMPPELRKSAPIAGVGVIEFPPDHPLTAQPRVNTKIN